VEAVEHGKRAAISVDKSLRASAAHGSAASSRKKETQHG
jgi:hypothetical protein